MHFEAPEKALQLVRKTMLLNPKYPATYASILTPQIFMIVSLSKLDRMDLASWAAEQLKTTSSNISADTVAGMLSVQDATVIVDMQSHLERAGL